MYGWIFEARALRNRMSNRGVEIMAVGSPFEMSPLFSRDYSGPLLPMWPFREEIFTRLFSHWPNLLKNTFHPIYIDDVAIHRFPLAFVRLSDVLASLGAKLICRTSC